MIDYEFFAPIVEQAAKRIAYKMDAPEELEDLEQEMWLAVVEGVTEGSDWTTGSSRDIHRRLGTVGAKYILSQKNLGMVMGSEQPAKPRPEALSSPLDQELVEWALPQLTAGQREIIRSAIYDSTVWVSRADLKDAFKALSEVVIIYEG